MIILTFAQAQLILGASRVASAGVTAKLRPIQLNDGNFMLDERVLADPDHSDTHLFLQSLPTRSVESSEISATGISLKAQGWTPDGYRQDLFNINSHWYGLTTPRKAYSFTSSGSAQYRCEIRAGEVGSTFDPVGVRHRVEQYSTDAIPFSTEIWAAYSVAFDSWSDFIVAGQWRAQEDGGDFLSEPVLSLQVLGGTDLAVIYCGTAEAVHTSQPAHVQAWRITCPRSVWMNFVFRFVLDPFGGGELQVWKDGVEIVDLSEITIGYNDVLGPRFKFGAYCDDLGTAVVHYANVEWGTTSLLDRIANPLPV